MRSMTVSAVLWCGAALVAACSHPRTADEIVAASARAHGGEALQNWKTMVIRGEVHQKDNRLWFRGEYVVYAQKPDRIRMETDLTKFERGRYFFSEILNGDKGWMIRNLLPVYRDGLADRYRAKLHRCDGIVYYVTHADSFVLGQEGVVEDRPTFVVGARIGDKTAKLYIDRENFLLLQEEYDDVKWIYSDFKELGGAIRASRVREVITDDGTTEVTYTYTYDTMELDVEIDPALFEEEMPGT